MTRLLLASTLILTLLAPFAAVRADDVDSLAGYYHVPPPVVDGYLRALGSYHDVALALYMAQLTKQNPDVIVGKVTHGESFQQIAAEFGVRPGTYTDPVLNEQLVLGGPPPAPSPYYGAAYPYYGAPYPYPPPYAYYPYPYPYYPYAVGAVVGLGIGLGFGWNWGGWGHGWYGGGFHGGWGFHGGFRR